MIRAGTECPQVAILRGYQYPQVLRTSQPSLPMTSTAVRAKGAGETIGLSALLSAPTLWEDDTSPKPFA
jgi:hypothetical protein